MRLFVQPTRERARALQGSLEIVDPEEQQQAVAGCRVIGAGQRWMLMRPQAWRQSRIVPSASTICPK